MAKLYNLVRVNTNTSGSGTIILGDAVTGFLSFVTAGVQDGDEISYGIKDGDNHEVGRGTYSVSGSSLTRSLLDSTTGSLLDLSGASEIYITALAEDIGNVVSSASATDGHLAVFDGSTGKIIKDGGVIESSDIYTDTYANRPSAGNDGNLFLPNNGFYVERDTGSAWTSWGPIFKMTPPINDDFSWVNQGTATIDTTNGGIYLLAPNLAGDNARLRVKNAPATPYTITTAILPHLHNVNFNLVAIGWRQSSDGKFVIFIISGEEEGTLRVSKYNSVTSYNNNYMNVRFGAYNTLVWLRISDDGTNRICSWSLDGQHFHQLHSINRTDFITPDQVLFGAQSINATYPAGMTLLSWKEE